MKLERQYRLLARAFPPSWRRRHGDDLVTTLLDGSIEGQRVVSLTDAADVTGRGIETRVRQSGPVGQTIAGGIALVTLTAAMATSTPAVTAAQIVIEAEPAPVTEANLSVIAESEPSTDEPSGHGEIPCTRHHFEPSI